MIDTKDISVVVQGAVGDTTKQCLKSIREFLPGAEIILSTWAGTNVDGCDYDDVIFNKDPGALSYTDKKISKLNNINRQIVSTIASIKKSNRKYVLKFRPDFILKNNDFLKYFDLYGKNAGDEYKIFQHKILTCTNFTRASSALNGRLLFHPSDMILFGLRDDLLNLFDIPQQTNFENDKIIIDKVKQLKYVPEQYLWISCLRKNGHVINYDGRPNNNTELWEKSEKYLVSNFIPISWANFGLIPPIKFYNFYENDYFTIITQIEYIALYNKYCDDNLDIPFDELRYLLNKYKNDKIANFMSRIVVLPLFFTRYYRQIVRKKTRKFLHNLFLYKSREKIIDLL